MLGGDRRLFVKEVTTVMENFSRAIGNCTRCGKRFDVPIVDGELAVLYPIVRGEPNGLDEGATTKVEFPNPTDSEMLTMIFLSVTPLDPKETTAKGYVPPESATTWLSAGETTIQTFDLSSEVVYDTDYVVHRFVIGNLWPYMGVGMLRAGSEPGLKPSRVLG
ncbi:hypothetical protein NGM10_17530 (plasmid) [Halorussus salilacus]|uniref:hypothetical protein n=1 Tax=Halorussus salilacus TaxID=2953750 RepID=UPI00209DA7A2|nr:hypothetical protein [Halorussus salilacus]USZ70127.1 hypothetical protein NGM10_17530 [Halorussus salilacus]